jgi:isoleucyl-tRNA synthetase
LQNTEDFDFSATPTLTNMLHLDHLRLLHALVAEVTAASEEYQYSTVVTLLMQFCETASADYFTALKDVLYCDQPKSLPRQEAQYMLGRTLEVLMRLLVPVLPYTAEEVFDKLKESLGLLEPCAALLTLATLTLPPGTDEWKSTMEQCKSLKQEVHRYMETFNSQVALEATLPLKTTAQLDLTLTLPRAAPESALRNYFGCAQLTLVEGTQFKVTAEPTKVPLCPRCRSHHDLTDAGVCARCEAAELVVTASSADNT